jgi:hypothetical protein
MPAGLADSALGCLPAAGRPCSGNWQQPKLCPAGSAGART